MVIVTKYFVQRNRPTPNADAECESYLLFIILKWE